MDSDTNDDEPRGVEICKIPVRMLVPTARGRRWGTADKRDKDDGEHEVSLDMQVMGQRHTLTLMAPWTVI